jgi:hypothetical protein
MKSPSQNSGRNDAFLVLLVTAMVVVGCPGLCILLSVVPSDQLHWYAAAAILPLSLLILLAFREMRTQQARLARGRCINCGYDLRATPDRCPECGAVPKRQ